MGFYMELSPTQTPGEFAEKEVPPVFWVLYLIAGFALACMAGAAHLLLWDLAKSGSWFDILLVGTIFLAIPAYILIGIKLAGVRKFVWLSPGKLVLGFRFFGRPIVRKELREEDVAGIDLHNKKPTPNLAPEQHDDPQYAIRGHWRVSVKTKKGRDIVVDRHTENEALIPLAGALKQAFQF